MTYRGRVKNGVIVLNPPASLPEGAEVEVTAALENSSELTWAEVFKDVIGKAEGLPPDSSINHDHYLYGAPEEMTSCFGDTSYFLALLIPKDVNHMPARQWAEHNRVPITTSDYVIVEVANYLSPMPTRRIFDRFLQALRSIRRVEVLAASPNWLERGIELYQSRPDKGWSLTDCISFAIMRDRGIREALTADRHFEQAGFSVLLKPAP